MLIKKLLCFLVSCYPRSFRAKFADQINADLYDLFKDAELMGWSGRIRWMLIEIRGTFFEVTRQHAVQIAIGLKKWTKEWLGWLGKTREDPMSEDNTGNWGIKDRKMALLASLPPLLIGLSFSVTWLIIGGKWYEASFLQLRFGLAAGLLLAGVVALGGLYALFRRFLVWGFTWLGADLVGFLLLLSGLADDRPFLISREVDYAILGLAMVFAAVVLIAAVLRAWQAAGLMSIGMSTTMALSNVHLMAIPPYNRADLAVLGVVFGMIFFLLTFFYVRTSKKLQIAILCAIGLINLGIVWLANYIWSGYEGSGSHLGRVSPFIPFAIFVVLMLLSGPLAGLFSKPIRKFAIILGFKS